MAFLRCFVRRLLRRTEQAIERWSTVPRLVRYQALAWLTVAAALAYLCRNAIGVAESTIRDELGLTLEQSGWFMGAFFWTYAIFQLPNGWFSERFGTRISLSVFAIGWSVATFGIGVAPAFWLLIVAQLVMGIAQAGILPASCNSIGHWMPLAQRSAACGFLAAGMQVGAIAASGLTAVLMVRFGWRWAFVALALPGIVWTIGFFFRFRDRPTENAEAQFQRTCADSFRSRGERVESGRRQPTNWGSCWPSCVARSCGGFAVSKSVEPPGTCFSRLGFRRFFRRPAAFRSRTRDTCRASYLAAMLLGAVSGGMLTDWIWRRTGDLRLSRSGVGAASLGACSLIILGAWFVQSAELAVGLLALGGFFAALAGPCAFATTIDIGGPRVPQVVAVMNMSGNFAAGACPVFAAMLFQLTANWNLILLLFAGVYLAGAMCWVFVNPKQGVR